MESLQEFIIAIGIFINNVLIPLLFSLALLFFIFNSLRFFVLGSHDQAGRDSAKRLALYGIAGFVLLVSIWGIVNFIAGGLNLQNDDAILPDYKNYMKETSGGSTVNDSCNENPYALDCDLY